MGTWLASSPMEYLFIHKHVSLISGDGLDTNRIRNFENINVPVVSLSMPYINFFWSVRRIIMLSPGEKLVVKHIHLSNNWQMAMFYSCKSSKCRPLTYVVWKWSNCVKEIKAVASNLSDKPQCCYDTATSLLHMLLGGQTCRDV